MNTEPGKPIDTNLSLQKNQASIFLIIMDAFVLDAMPGNVAIQSALSKDIVTEN